MKKKKAAEEKPARVGKKKPSARGPKPKAKEPEGRQGPASDPALTPLIYMLRVLQDETASPARRDAMAKAAAPFIHSREREPSLPQEPVVLEVRIDLRDP